MKSIGGHVVEMVLLRQGGMAAPWWCNTHFHGVILKLSIRAFVSFKLKGFPDSPVTPCTVKNKWVYIKPWCYLTFFFESPPSSSWTQKTFSFWSVNCARAHTFLYSAAQWATVILNLVHIIISVRSWNFKDGGSLKASFWAKNQHATKKKSLKNSYNDSLSKSANIVLSKSILDVKN